MLAEDLESPCLDGCDQKKKDKLRAGGDSERGLPMLLSNENMGSRSDKGFTKEDTEDKSEAVQRSESESNEQRNSRDLFVITFIGSVDDLSLFVPMLVGKGFSWTQLMPGAFIASSLIVLMCLSVGLCKPVANCLAKIPLQCIVFVFAASLLVQRLLHGIVQLLPPLCVVPKFTGKHFKQCGKLFAALPIGALR